MAQSGKKESDRKNAPEEEARKASTQGAKKAVNKKAKKKAANNAPRKKAGKKVKRKKARARKKTTRKTSEKKTPAKRSRGKKKPSAAPGDTLHCTLAPTGNWSMVLPTSAIAEITEYSPPVPLEDTPEWLLGQVEWEDWQVPVISYAALIDGVTPETATARSRIMVVKSLSNTARLPFIGVMVAEIPKLVNISESELRVTGDEGRSLGVHCKVKLAGQNAVIPDLDRLSQLVGQAAYGTVEKDGSVAQP